MILDVCCGPKHMWFDKNHPNAIYGDIRQETHTYHSDKWGDQTWTIDPDILYNFMALPFQNNVFSLIVFDPPHLQRLGETSFMAKKYGRLTLGWEEQIHAGFKECFRVLKPAGTLIFKWNETDFSVKKIIEVLGHQPLFGNHSGKFLKSHWLAFIKED